jgi:hypothetical protein
VTWLWVVVAAVALAGLASLVWWSSGRARIGTFDPGRRTADQRAELDHNRTRTMRNRDGGGGLGQLP